MAKLWPFTPTINSREEMSFRTDVRQTPEGEMRESLRTARQALRYEYVLDERTSSEMAELFRSDILGDWIVPVWFEATSIIVPAGSTSFPVIDGDYRVGELAFVGNGNGGEAIEVSGYSEGVVTLADATTIDSSIIMPARICFARNALDARRLSKNYRQRSIEFVSRENANIADQPFPELDDVPVLDDGNVASSPLSESITQAREYIDNGMGLIEVEPVRDVLEGRHDVRHIDQGLTQVMRRKRWLHYLRGRERAFWLPTWSADLRPIGSIGASDTEIDVQQLGVDPSQVAGRAIMVEGGSQRYFRRIESVSESNGDWVLTIADALGEEIEAPRIGFMTLLRLDTDSVEFRYRARNISEVSVTAVEVQA